MNTKRFWSGFGWGGAGYGWDVNPHDNRNGHRRDAHARTDSQGDRDHGTWETVSRAAYYAAGGRESPSLRRDLGRIADSSDSSGHDMEEPRPWCFPLAADASGCFAFYRLGPLRCYDNA